ncbi:UBX domain-containing protein [Ditylenchus destructor]|uniref:UBX domain-containing protein n=1 Tax=Ditylenchus destructor TaxID=166010 RepID=A0AAD4NCU0_9BILA|nr:UBX domain-containing protein [Ditylenchus destructor]
MDEEKQSSSSNVDADDHTEDLDTTTEAENDYLTDGSDDVEWIGPSNWDEPPKSSENDQIPLIPIDYTSVVEAAQNFIAVFEARYGPSPPFFQGSLQDAIAVAFGELSSPILERRPLAIYLHNDYAVASHLFAQSVMCRDDISSLLKGQFILWGWDMTYKENRQKLYEWLATENLMEVAGNLQSVHSSKYPVLVILLKDRNTIMPFTIIKGHDNAENALQKLMMSLDTFMRVKHDEAADDQKRIEREQIRQEQAEEYEKALAADRAKREEEAKKLELEREEELKHQQAKEKRKLRQAELASSLPEEPAENEKDVVSIRLRLPDGMQNTRRFRTNDSVQCLVNFVGSLGFVEDEYSIWTSDFPKKDVTSLDDLSKTFMELNWPHKEVVTIDKK